jgi:hypothetical protein
VDRGFRGLDRIMLVVNWGGWAGEVVDFVHFHEERKRDVVPKELETRVVAMLRDVFLATCEQVIDAKDIAALIQEAVDEM